jgi:hypothetical protein
MYSIVVLGEVGAPPCPTLPHSRKREREGEEGVPPLPMCLHPLFVDRGGEGHRHRARRGRGAQSERGVVRGERVVMLKVRKKS